MNILINSGMKHRFPKKGGVRRSPKSSKSYSVGWGGG